jgi:hypothetical protein
MTSSNDTVHHTENHTERYKFRTAAIMFYILKNLSSLSNHKHHTQSVIMGQWQYNNFEIYMWRRAAITQTQKGFSHSPSRIAQPEKKTGYPYMTIISSVRPLARETCIDYPLHLTLQIFDFNFNYFNWCFGRQKDNEPKHSLKLHYENSI